MEQSSLTYKTFKNISYSVIGYVWPMVFALFITPIIIFKLGVKDYGIYLFIYTFLGLLGLLDIGAGTAVTKYMASYSGQKNNSTLLEFIHTANSLLIIIGATGLIVSAAITSLGMFAPSLLAPQLSAYSQYSILFLIAGAIFFVSCLSNIPSSLFTALQRFDINNKISVVSVTVSSLSLLGVILAGGSLQIIFTMQLVITIIFAFISFYYARKILPEVSFSLGWNKKYVKDCYSFGAVSSINAIASTALASLDRIIIPFYTGPSNLTYYSVPGNIAGKVPGIANTLSTITFPMASSFDGSGDLTRIEILYVRSFRLITIISAALTVTAIAFAHKALLFWLNADFASKSTNIMIILAYTNFILALFGPLSNFLLGLGKLKFLTTMSVFMGLLNATLLIMFLPPYGITGAAWAYLLSVLPVAYMFYYTERHYLKLSGRNNYYAKKILGTIITFAIIWVIDSYLLSALAINLWTLLLQGGVSVILYLILYKIFGFFEEEDWRDMELFYQQILQKFKFSRS